MGARPSDDHSTKNPAHPPHLKKQPLLRQPNQKPQSVQSQSVKNFGQKARQGFSWEALFAPPQPLSKAPAKPSPPTSKSLAVGQSTSVVTTSKTSQLQLSYAFGDSEAVLQLRTLNGQAQVQMRRLKANTHPERSGLLKVVQKYQQLERELAQIDKLLAQYKNSSPHISRQQQKLQKDRASIEAQAQKLSTQKVQNKKTRRDLAELMQKRKQINQQLEALPSQAQKSNPQDATTSEYNQRHMELTARKAAIMTTMRNLRLQYKAALIILQASSGLSLAASNGVIFYVLKAGMLFGVFDIGRRAFVWNVMHEDTDFIPLIRVSYKGYTTARKAVEAVSSHAFEVLK